MVAVFRDGTWTFHAPLAGWQAWVEDAAEPCLFDGTAWIPLLSGGGLGALGINATADAVNRLAVGAPAVLFNAESDDIRVKLNKAAAGDTASFLFQTGWSGRAEFGLAGNDDFSVKVSPDGATWRTALVIDKDTGAATVNCATEAGGLVWNSSALTLHDTRDVAQGVGGGILFTGKFNAAGTPSTYGWIRGFKEDATDGSVTGGLVLGTRAGDMVFKTLLSGTAPVLDDLAAGTSMVIKDTGNVGIGALSPEGRIEVVQGGSDTAGANHLLRLAHSEGGAGQFGWRFDGAGGALVLDRYYGSAWSEVLRVDRTSGNLGIGTSSPGSKLHVAGDARFVGSAGTVSVDTTGARIKFNRPSINYIQLDDPLADLVVEAEDSTALMRITQAGNVGIGTLSPAGLLHVSGATPVMILEETDQVVDGKAWRFYGIAGSFYLQTLNDARNAAESAMAFGRSGTTVTSAYIHGIYGSTTASAANVHVVAGGRLYRSTSSIRYKTDVEDLGPQYRDRILEMRPVWYRSTCEADDPAHSFYGLIAEEVADIDPRLVHWRHDEQGFEERTVTATEIDPETGEAVTVERTERVEVRVPLDEPVAEGVMYDRLVPHLIATVQRLARAVHGDVSRDALYEADLAAASTALDRARVEAREAARRQIEAVSAAAMAGYTRAEIECWPQKEQAVRALLAGTATPAEAGMIRTAADLRGITSEDLARRVVTRAAAFRTSPHGSRRSGRPPPPPSKQPATPARSP